MMRWMVMVLFLSLSSLWAGSVQDIYPFDSVEDQRRFDATLHRYRCVVCQNQSLADSNAPVAIDIKQTVYTFMQTGKSDQALDQFLVSRYGDFIRLSPPLHGLSVLLWLMPGLLGIGAVCGVFYARRRYAGN